MPGSSYVSTDEDRRAVMSFSSNKAPGHDRVTMFVVKDALPRILPVPSDIVNQSLSSLIVQSSVFPVAWKISEVIPLPKDEDHEIANAYRTVSLLPLESQS